MYPPPTSPKHLVVVVGPTGVGKTSCCVQLAQHLHTEIISADARQCYQGMAIGTAQPTPEVMQGIPHHLIGCLPPQAPYNAGIFVRHALSILKNLWEKHNIVLATGGSGLYIQALCQGLDPMPQVPESIRKMLRKKLQEEGLPALTRMLAIHDPVYHEEVEPENSQRILRALEVCLTTGQPYSRFRQKKPVVRPFKTILIGLKRERQILYKHIDQRVDEMLHQGLLREATALYPYRHYNALQTIGYREIFGYLDGQYSQEEAIRLVKRNTRRYAKRQLTWFGRNKTIVWFHPSDTSAILKHIFQQAENKPCKAGMDNKNSTRSTKGLS